MEHRTSAELQGFAEVTHPRQLSKKELLQRWASGTCEAKGCPFTYPERDRIQTSEGTVSSAARELPADRSLLGPSAISRSEER